MCGLAFLYAPHRRAENAQHRMWNAVNSMRHRGPDEQQVLVSGAAVLGHCRLSIIDLHSSKQPMQDATGIHSLAYNGETYNYRELRQSLASRWKFETNGDTEVVLAGLVIEGPSFLEKMEGMWALALWSADSETLLLARDRFGKKPLYYQSANGEFAAGSELGVLRTLCSQPWSEDMHGTADFLRYGFFLPGTTAYQDVNEVLPGHFLVWSPGRATASQPYWKLPIARHEGPRRDVREELREAFFAAVQKRRVADVEVGAFLSGGVDSSLVVAALSRMSERPPKTFTIGFSEASFDERRYARQVAELFATEHHERCLDGFEPQDLLALVLDHVGQPFGDSSILPTAMVSRLASEHVKVALSGDGGDELFSGYQRYQARVIMRWYTRLPQGVRAGVGNLIRRLPESNVHHSRSLVKKAHLFQEALERETGSGKYIAPNCIGANELAALLPDSQNLGHSPPNLPDTVELDDVSRMMAYDALVYLPQDILAKVDRATMAYSLEARCPFLDNRLVELAFSFPIDWHRGMFSGKRMLHDSMADMLPRSVWSRRKQGFGVPIGTWFQGVLKNRLRQLVETVESPLDGAAVNRMLDLHNRRLRDHGQKLWNIFIYLLWRERESKHAS